MKNHKWIEIQGVMINTDLVSRFHKLVSKQIAFTYVDGTVGYFKYDTNEDRDADFDYMVCHLTGVCGD